MFSKLLTVYSDKELSEKLANDLKDSKNDQNKITNSINDMGKKILDNTAKEIKRFLI